MEDSSLRAALTQVLYEGRAFLARFARNELPGEATLSILKQALGSLEHYSTVELRSDQEVVFRMGKGLFAYGFRLADLLFLYRQAVKAAELDPTLCKMVNGLLSYSRELTTDNNVRMQQEMRWCIEGFELLEELHPMIEEKHSMSLDALYTKTEEEVTLYCATMADILKYLALLKDDLVQNQVFSS